jgi:hypothetical protein
MGIVCNINCGDWATDWTIQCSNPAEARGFYPLQRPSMFWGSTQPRIKWILRTLPPRVRRSGHEADHSPPSSAEIENDWSCTSTAAYVFMVCRGTCTFAFALQHINLSYCVCVIVGTHCTNAGFRATVLGWCSGQLFVINICETLVTKPGFSRNPCYIRGYFFGCKHEIKLFKTGTFM